MKAIGNFTVDFNWQNGKAQQVTIVSNAGAELKVRCNRGAMDIANALITVDGDEVAAQVDENGIATIPCEKDQTVVIDFTQEATPATFTQKWTASPVAPWSDEALATGEYPEAVSVNGLAVHKAETAVTATRGGEVTIKFVYSGGSHKLNVLGVDLVNAEGTVVASDYHHGTTGGSHSNNTYTLTGITAGDYTLRYFVGQGNGDALNQTNGNITVTGLALTGVAPSKLPQAGKYYRIGYDFGTAGVKYMQSTASGVSGKANALLMTDEKGEGSIFLVEEVSDGNLRLKSISTGKYLKEDNSNRGLATEGANVTFTEGTDGKIKIQATSYLHPNVSGTTYFVDRCGSDGCAQHNLIVEEVKVRSLTIDGPAYVGASATWNGETKALPATWALFDGITITDPALSINCPANYTFTGFAENGSPLGNTVEIASLTANRTITANFNIAFFSATVGEKWINIVRKADANHAMFLGSNEVNAKPTFNKKDYTNTGMMWSFVGTADNFKIYNYLSGETLALTPSAETIANGTEVKMVAAADAQSWKLIEKNGGYAITPINNNDMSLNSYGGTDFLGANIKFYAAGDGGSHWNVDVIDTENLLTMAVSIDKIWESSPRVAELTFGINGNTTQTRITENVEAAKYYLPAGVTLSLSSMTYRGYTFNGIEGVDDITSFTIPEGGLNLNVSYTANDERTLFYTPGANGHPYRIPAIATAPNGDIFAICDFRPCRGDIGNGDVDIVCRISTDNGKTWGDEFKIADGDGGSTNRMETGYGDPAIVVDRESNKILVMMVAGRTTCWNGRWESSKKGDPNADAVNRVARVYGTLNETTGEWEWTAPVEMTDHMYSLFMDGETPTVPSMFIGSGKICQSRVVKKDKYYRLYCALWTNNGGNRVIYSDDFGASWNVLGTLADRPASGGDEPKCEELPDGSVILSSRVSGGRWFNIFTFNKDGEYKTGTWGQAVKSTTAYDGSGNGTNGEIYKVKAIRKEDGQICDVMLQSIPAGPGRTNVKVYYKEMEYNADGTNKYTPADFAADWKVGKHVSNTDACYSTMHLQADGRIGFFFEEVPGGYCMVYIPYKLEDLTAGKYSLYTVNSTIGEYKIGTFYASEAVVIPEGVKAYVATEEPVMENGTGVITMTELEGIIPARTGAVILAEQGDYKFIPSISYGTAVEGNMLVGFEAANNKAESKKAVTVAEDYTTYVLTVQNEKAGFYRKVKGSTFNVGNNKAYLSTPAQGANSISIRFEGDGTTDIEASTLNPQRSTEVYDLQGRRVLNPAKGVYIVNGKKVVIK